MGNLRQHKQSQWAYPNFHTSDFQSASKVKSIRSISKIYFQTCLLIFFSKSKHYIATSVEYNKCKMIWNEFYLNYYHMFAFYDLETFDY